MGFKVNLAFVGAGPGSKELITLKGYNKLKEADVVVYAGSLVNKELLEYCKPECEIHDSAYLDLNEIVEIMEKGCKENKKVVRLHTGDYSLFGSLREQMEELNKREIEYELVPGVSSFLGAASSIRREYTVPEVSQSLIITRIAGRTPVPDKESIRNFASHQTSMVIFLSTQKIEDVTKELIEGGYPEDTPAALVYKATWPDERIIKGNLTNLADKVKEAGITKTALIMVGRFLGEEYHYSKLYDEDFKHEYRK